MLLKSMLFIISAPTMLRRLLVMASPDILTPIRRPDTYEEYKISMEQCEWEPADIDRKSSCEGDILVCKVYATFDEGEGYWYITRYGPYTTTGGFQQIYCYANAPAVPEGKWITRGVLGAVDPYTGDYYGFPPLHVHHFTPAAENVPKIPAHLETHMPWLTHVQRSALYSAFPSGGAGFQCTVKQGGLGCMSRVLPRGHGKRSYSSDIQQHLVMHTQDVRQRDSPPITHYIEYAIAVIEAPHQRQQTTPKAAERQMNTMVPVIDLCMTVGGDKNPYMYKLQFDVAMYNFVSYHYAVRAHLIANRIHFHAQNGDEVWIVRGTQQDLGIPTDAQRPVVAHAHQLSIEDAISIGRFEDMQQLQKQMESSIRLAAERFNQRTYRSSAGPFQMNNGMTHAQLVPFNPMTSNNQSTVRAPQILCKYYGQTEYLSSEDINNMAAATRQQYEREVLSNWQMVSRVVNRVGMGGGEKITKGFPNPANEWQAPDDHSSPTFGIIAPEEQAENRFAGVLPGHYYRAASSSQQKQDTSYPPHCDNFEVEPGEQITILHFSAPRIDPLDRLDGEDHFNDTMLTIEQHTRFHAMVSMPDFPVL